MSKQRGRNLPLGPMILGGVVLLSALWLFWPRQAGDDVPTLVLTPDSVREQASVESAEPNLEEAAIETEAIETPADEILETPKTTESRIIPPPPQKEEPQSSSIRPSSSGEYQLFVGSFKEKANAERNAKGLKDKGIEASVVAASGELWRVRVGYFADAEQAREYASWLKDAHGLDGWPSKR